MHHIQKYFAAPAVATSSDDHQAYRARIVNMLLWATVAFAAACWLLFIGFARSPIILTAVVSAAIATSLVLRSVLRRGHIRLVALLGFVCFSLANFANELTWPIFGVAPMIAVLMIAWAAFLLGRPSLVWATGLQIVLLWLLAGLKVHTSAVPDVVSALPSYALQYTLLFVITAASFAFAAWQTEIAHRIAKQSEQAVLQRNAELEREVTERRRLERDLQAANTELEQRIRERMQEVAERRRAEAALRDTHQRLRQVLESITDCFYAVDSQLRFTYVNPQAEAHFSLRKEDMLGRTYTDVLPAMQGHDVLRKLQEALSGQRTLHLDFLSPVTLRWVDMSIYPADDGNGLAIYFRDVTERKLSEETLRASERRLNLALDASSAGTWSWDVASNTSTWDDRYHDLYGYAPDTPRTFETWLGSIYPSDRIGVRERIQRLLADSADCSWNEEFRALHPVKGERWMLGLGRIDRDGAGKAVSFIGLNIDITERKLVEEALQHTATVDAFRVHLMDALQLLGRADEIKSAASRVLGEQLQVDHVYYSEVESDDEHSVIPCNHDTSGKTASNSDWYRIPDTSQYLLGEFWANRAVVIADVHLLAEIPAAERAAYAAASVRAFIAYPLLKAGQLVSVLCVTQKRPREWAAHEVAMVRETAERTWAALERALAEEALRESEERLRLAQAGGMVGIWDRNAITGSLRWSPELEGIYGLEPGSVHCYVDFTSRVHPDDLADMEANRDRAIRAYQPFDLEFRIILPSSGEVRWIASRGGATYDELGRMVRVVGSSTDVTKRKLAEEALKRTKCELEMREVRLQERTTQLAKVNTALQAEVDERKQAEDALRQRVEFEARVASISSKFMSMRPEDFDEGLQFTLQTLGEFAQVDLCSFSQILDEVDPQQCVLVRHTHEWQSATCSEAGYITAIGTTFPLDADEGWWIGQCARYGYAQVNSECALPLNATYARDLMRRLGTKSVLIVPVMHRSQVVAVLALTSLQHERTWTSENVGLLRVVAGIIGAAWERKQQALALQAERDLLERRVDERTRELTQLLVATQAVSSTLELKGLLALILDQLQVVIPGSDASVFDWLDDGTQKLISYVGPVTGDVLIREFPAPTPEDLHLQAMITARRPILISDLFADEPFANAARALSERTLGISHAGSALYVPLVFHERLVGMLYMRHAQPHFYTSHHANLAMAFANHAAVAIENARLHVKEKQSAAMAERSRLARELHDSVSQALFSIVLGARTVIDTIANSTQVQSQAIKGPLNYVLDLSEAALMELRALVFELRPEALQQEGLVTALRKQATVLMLRQRIQTTTEFMTEEPDLPLSVKDALYRIGIEAIQNLIKHAQATQVWIRLYPCGRGVALEVKDNGRGFDPFVDYHGHFGLRTMQERAEQGSIALHLESQAGQGTKVSAVYTG